MIDQTEDYREVLKRQEEYLLEMAESKLYEER